MKDAGIDKLAARAQRTRYQEPTQLTSDLRHIEQKHREISEAHANDLEGWQRALEGLAKEVAKVNAERQALESEESGRGSSTGIGRSFRNQLAPILAIRMEEHHKSALAGKSGRHHGLIATFLTHIDYLTIAHIVITTVLDCVGRGSLITTPLSTVYATIGERLDDEAFFRTIKEQDPQAFSKIERFVLNNSVKGYKFKVKEADAMSEITYDFMGVKDRAKVGDWAFSCLQSLTLWFESYRLFDGHKKTTHFLSLSPEGLKYRDLIQAAQDERAYECWPMVHPPHNWEINDQGKVEKRGGYLSFQKGKPATLIRSNKGSIPSPTAMDALHAMQNVPFRVNQFIYNTMNGLLASSVEVGKFKTFEKDSWDDKHKPLIDWAVLNDKWDENRNQKPAYKQAMKDLRNWHDAREVATKERVSPYRVLQMAARFIDVERFFLPAYFDNRLRKYYMVDTLNPQGSDFQKALLQFSNGNPVTDENREAVRRDLLITLANAAAWEVGNTKSDKLSLDDRVKWAEELVAPTAPERLDLEAEDPISNQSFWTECDEPFQFLAALHEYYSIFIWGTSDVARIPNGRDATNSGSQLIGGIVKDPKTCYYSNVTQTYNGVTADKPQDLYGVVAIEAQILVQADPWVDGQLEKARKRIEVRLQELMEAGVENPHERAGNAVFNIPSDVIDRKVTKKASMCTAYGASWRSKNEYISEELDKQFTHDDGKSASLCEKIIVTNATIQGQDAAFPALAKMNKWFRTFAKACLSSGLTLVKWRTPNGSLIVQEYLEPNVERVDTYAMGGAKYWKPIRTNSEKRDPGITQISFQSGYTDVIKESKTQTALAANWTHSHDAVIIQNVVSDWEGDFFVVHDCLYAPAGRCEEMVGKARQALYDVITSDPLQKLMNECNVSIALPPIGDANVSEVLEHPYAFS